MWAAWTTSETWAEGGTRLVQTRWVPAAALQAEAYCGLCPVFSWYRMCRAAGTGLVSLRA